MSKRQFPIEIRDVAPGEGAVRVTGKRVNGGSDGLHTGGAWLYQNKIWKPLDGRPYQNAPVHVETTEEDCLVALQGKPLFPKNWEVKEANGRRFIVRNNVPIFPGGNLRLTLSDIQEIDKGIVEMNRTGWEVNDDLIIGKDRNGKLFIVDLSAANYSTMKGPMGADDSYHFNKLCELAGFKNIPQMRSVARELAVQALFNRNFKDKTVNRRDIKYFYSSENKVEIKDAVDLTYLIAEIPPKDREIAKKYFWLGSIKPLPENQVRVSKLTLQYQRKS